MAAIPALTIEPEVQSTRTFRHVLSVIVRDPLSLASTIVIFLFILIAAFAPLVAPSSAEGAGKTTIKLAVPPRERDWWSRLWEKILSPFPNCNAVENRPAFVG